ncbi:hypothetical protein AV545_08235 [Paenibacillus jamilae]|uniref:hypothetical protein n=1 Tax=Paenibacillus jamilae TaxID=114136 RepID=UPI0007AC14BD|nr:hypothetical protein [Paenibacillus jamilae]KZE81470.1 hypothetical protein AV545_08235 [Paenibacillus jamilae]
MASEKTPNLGLNQIDRTSPKTTYFDLEKYLDQNWRSVDEFAGEVNDGVNEIKKRLDTTERKAVTLEPGVQIVHAEKAAPFSLTGLSGRTLVNLLGRVGSCDRIDSLLGWEADLAVDTSNKAQGTGSIKVTAKNASGVYNVYSTGLKLTGGRYYVALADVKNINASSNIYVNFSTGGNKALKQSKDQSRFVTIYTKCAPTNDTAINLEVSSISTATGQAFYADAIRLYEINASDYAALDSMTAEQIVTKYPYVDSIMPARNPYAMRYGENMLPGFYEWEAGGSAQSGLLNFDGGYSAKVAARPAGSPVQTVNYYTRVPVVPGKSYTYSVEHNGVIALNPLDKFGNAVSIVLPGFNEWLETQSVTVTVPNDVYFLRVGLGNNNGPATERSFKNPMLNIGSIAKPFKPHEDSMLALQTDLYADPVTGANADTVFERDGQYFKSKTWHGVTLDGAVNWNASSPGQSFPGFKVVYTAPNQFPAWISYSDKSVKHDGKILNTAKTGGQWSTLGADATETSIDGSIYVSVPVADSGWADGYTPTQDDIKAYFYGYKAYDANTITPAQAQAATTATWNGTGTKYWVQRVGAPNFTQSVPQQSYAGYTPYQLVYQLATPTVEPIVSEGQLSFVEGDNQVEVGTGIVLREATKPAGDPAGDVYVQINRIDYGTAVKYRVSKFLAVYVGNRKDSGWETLFTPDGQSYGQERLRKSRSQTMVTEPYNVTYLMLDRSPVIPFTGAYATNEKTLLADLVDDVQQATTRVSVLENKKADKDNPTWLTPTLLNGAMNTSANEQAVQYLKTSDSYVMLRGVLNVAALNTMAFCLPAGYRPLKSMRFVVSANQAFGQFLVGASGDCFLSSGSLTVIDLSGIVFLAEQ